MPKRRTAPSTQKLSEVARHVVMPEGIVTTVWPRVAAKCLELDVQFDGWQHGIGQIALGKRADGKYAATVGGVVLSIPRQVGKTFLVGMIIIALCLLFPGLTVLWSAHRTRTATKTFTSIKGLTSRKKIRPNMLEPRNTNGEQEIRFRNGSVIMFGAREQGFGRGFDEVDIEVFDEAQILTEKALEDMVAATNQSRQEAGALLFFMGTPPRPTDPGEEFSNRRKKALSGKTKNMVYVELSADDNADPDDHRQWAKANPSFPAHTPLEAMERMRENLTNVASFRREGLGIWDSNADGSRAISSDHWSAAGVDEPRTGVKSFAVAFSFDGSRISVAGAHKHDDGIHVELIDSKQGLPEDLERGLAGVADWLAARWRETAQIALSGSAGAAVLARLLVERKVPKQMIQLLTTPQYLQSCAMFHDSVKDRSVSHLNSEGQAALDASVAITDYDKRGGWKATIPDSDETPLEAVSVAHWAARTTKRKPRGERERRAVIL